MMDTKNTQLKSHLKVWLITWKEDFLLFADSKLNTKGLPQWEEILGTEGMRLVEELPHDASKAEAKAEFKQIMEMVNKQGEAAKDIARDFSDYKRSPDIEIDADNAAKQQWLRDELAKYHPLSHVLDKMIYAVELMEDNHKEMCERLGVSIDHPHYVCADSLEYDYTFGEPVGVEVFFN